MTSLDEFLKDQGFKFIHSDNEVILEKTKKVNIIAIVVGAIGMAILVLIGSWLSSPIMYVIALLVLLIILRFHFRGLRPRTIFDWTYTTMVRKSVFFFVNSKTVKIKWYKSIDVKVIDLATSSSEGVDEFQKTVFLNTANGEINVVDFYTDFEAVEPEIPMIMEIIDAHLKKAK